MSIIVKDNGGGNFDPVPAGPCKAVCWKVFDIGQQSGFQGKIAHQVVIYWETEHIIEEGEFEGKRRLISKTYTASLSEKANLRKDLESWRGKKFTPDELEGFDIEKLVGVNCLLNVIHNQKGDKTYANISAVMPTRKGEDKLSITTDPSYIPQWILEKMAAGGVDYAERQPEEFEDDIPF